jgi:iron complex outermembrane receptor protein
MASRAKRLLGGVALICLITAPAVASAAAADSSTVETLVVTAQRREEDVQRVPIAISAVSGENLEAQGVTGFKELGMRVPSLRFGAGVTGGENVITMRGLGSQNTTPGGDSPVAYNIDGVYVQRTTAIDPEFYDIDRVEVLRGPQGTLYGRNSVGGSINVILNKPTYQYGAGIDGLYGNYDQWTVRGWANLPLIESEGAPRAAIRVTGVIAQHDPYAINLSTKPTATHNQDAQDYWMIRGQLKADLTEDVDLLLLASTAHNDTPAATITAWWQTPFRYTNPPLGIPAGAPCDFSTEAKFDPRRFCKDAAEIASNEVNLFSGTLNWRFDGATLTSVTAYSRSKVSQTSDGDGSDLPIAIGDPWYMTQKQFSQEVRLASNNSEAALQWVAGFIYFYANNYEDFGYTDTGFNDIFPIPGIFDAFNFVSHGNTKTEAWAPFGQLDYDLGKTGANVPLIVTLGLRYSHDKKYGYNYLDYQLPFFCPGPNGSCGVAEGPFEKSWGEVTGKFGLTWQASENFMLYGSVSRGYLSGGNIIGLANVYGPERLWSYDAGFKSRFFDDRAQLNVAVYHESIEGLQVFIQSSTQSGINNVDGTTHVNGLEAEFTAVPVDDLRLNATLTLTDAKYGRYITTDNRFGGPGPGCSPVGPPFLCNFEGNRLNQTPPYTVNLGAEYRFHTSFGTITPRVDAFFSGEVEFLPDNFPTSTQKSYHMTNLRLTWTSLDGRYKLEGFVNNVENEDVISNDGLQSISLGQQGLEPDNFVYFPPRTYGVRLAVRFGG